MLFLPQVQLEELISHQSSLDQVSEKAQALLQTNADAKTSHAITQLNTRYQAIIALAKVRSPPCLLLLAGCPCTVSCLVFFRLIYGLVDVCVVCMHVHICVCMCLCVCVCVYACAFMFVCATMHACVDEKVNFQCRLSYGALTAPVCSCMHQHLCTCEKSQMLTAMPLFGRTKLLCTLIAMGSAALMAAVH